MYLKNNQLIYFYLKHLNLKYLKYAKNLTLQFLIQNIKIKHEIHLQQLNGIINKSFNQNQAIDL